MAKRYRDFYGNTASIKEQTDGKFRLRVKLASGRLITNKSYDTFRGARVAMGKGSDGWEEI